MPLAFILDTATTMWYAVPMGYSYKEETVTTTRWVIDEPMDAKNINMLIDKANEHVTGDAYDDAYFVTAEDDQIVITFRGVTSGQ